jgi:hypothetical protein
VEACTTREPAGNPALSWSAEGRRRGSTPLYTMHAQYTGQVTTHRAQHTTECRSTTARAGKGYSAPTDGDDSSHMTPSNRLRGRDRPPATPLRHPYPIAPDGVMRAGGRKEHVDRRDFQRCGALRPFPRRCHAIPTTMGAHSPAALGWQCAHRRWRSAPTGRGYVVASAGTRVYCAAGPAVAPIRYGRLGPNWRAGRGSPATRFTKPRPRLGGSASVRTRPICNRGPSCR